MYMGTKLEIRTVEEIKKDIESAKLLTDEIIDFARKSGRDDHIRYIARYNGISWLDEGVVKNIFIGDSDSLIMKTKDLAEVTSFLYEIYPYLERVTIYARAKTLFKKHLEELKILRRAGLTRLHVGLETGDDELLRYINKGATSEEMIIAGKKALKAGFELSEYVMIGLGGSERWEQHVLGSARVLNEINPHFIRLRTLNLMMAQNSPLYKKSQDGEFTVQSIVSLIKEVQELIERLDVTSQLIGNDFAMNYYMGDIDGILPNDKSKMMQSLDTAMKWFLSKEKKSSMLKSLNTSNPSTWE